MKFLIYSLFSHPNKLSKVYKFLMQDMLSLILELGKFCTSLDSGLYKSRKNAEKFALVIIQRPYDYNLKAVTFSAIEFG